MDNINMTKIEISGLAPESILSPMGISFEYNFEIDGKNWVILGDYCHDPEGLGFELIIKIDDLKFESEGSCYYPFTECRLNTKGLPLYVDEEYKDDLFKIFAIIEKTLFNTIEIKMMNLLMEKHLTKN